MKRFIKTLWHVSYTVYFENLASKTVGDTTFTIDGTRCSTHNLNEIRDWIKNYNPVDAQGNKVCLPQNRDQ